MNTFSKGVSALVLTAALIFPLHSAYAASLTADQIQAILNLLAAFSVDQATINNVSDILHNTTSTPASSSGAGWTASASAVPSVDLKVNGFDGPIVNVSPDTTALNVTWTTSGVQSCFGPDDRVFPSGSIYMIKYLPGSGSLQVPVTLPPGGSQTVDLICKGISDGKTYRDDLQVYIRKTNSTTPPAGIPVITSATLTSSPSSGLSPLNVTFSADAGGPGYIIDFGDGSRGGIYGSYAPYSAPAHTYTKSGTYTARLLHNPLCNPYTGDDCLADINSPSVGSTVITVQ